MAAKNVDIKINTTASGNGAKQTAADMDKLAASSTKAAAATNTVTASSSKLGQRAGAVGLQIQDIAVQAQSGTHAVTILAQQGSQLASIFGPQGAIIGSIIALGAVAAQTFFKIGSDAETTTKKAEFLAEAIDEVAKEAGKIKSSEIDMGSEAITKSIGLANELAQAFFEASEEERRLSEAALDRTNKLKQAEIELKRLRGDITEEQAITQERQLAQDQILEKANLQTKAEQQRVAEAKKAQEIARDEYIDRGNILVESQAELEMQQQILQATIDRRIELEKIAKQTETVFYGTGESYQQPSPAAEAAKKELATTPFDAEIKALNEKIEALAKATTGDLVSRLTEAADALGQAERAVQNISDSVAKQAENIAAQAQTEILLQNQRAITENIAAEAKMIADVVTDIQAVGTLQESAKTYILQAVSDQKITVEEQVKISQNLTILLTSVKGLQTEQINAIRGLIEYNNTVKIQMDGLQEQINKLQQRNTSPRKID